MTNSCAGDHYPAPARNPPVLSRRTFAYSTLRDEMWPEKQQLLFAVNDLEQYRHDPAKRQHYEALLREKERDFESAPRQDLATWWWHRCIMKGMVANSLGNREEAGAYEFESLQHVCGDTEKEAISHNNLCDTYRSLGHYADAESEGLRAYRLWPSHAGIVCNFALALAKNRKKREAAQILGTLIADSDMGDPRSIVVAHVRHEQELQEILSLLADAYDHSDE